MTTYPRVSVLIPVFNREAYIGQCIESALMQIGCELEVIIVDNASKDDTWKICQHYAEQDGRVKIFRNEKNVGPVRNWLACLNYSRGEYIKILWSDDLLHPDYLKKTLPYFSDCNVGFVYSEAVLFERSIEDSAYILYQKFKNGQHDSSEYIEQALFNGDVPFSPGCAIFRAEDVRKNLLLNVPNRINSDFSMHAIGNDLLLFLLTAYQYKKFAVVCEPLAYFRSHDESITTSAPAGKIELHYDLAKGYFAENYIKDKAIKKELNAEFLWHLIKFKDNNYGIKKLQDFYPSENPTNISILRFLNIKRFLNSLWKRI